MSDGMQRRDFLKYIGGASAAIGLTRGLAAQSSTAPASAPTTAPAVPTSAPATQATLAGLTLRDLPRRKLGRIGIEVPPLSMGTAAMGHAFYKPEEFEPVVHAALDAGVMYLDTAPLYDVAEERLAPVLARRRQEVFLASKSNSPTGAGTTKLIEQSLRRMRTDHLDLFHIHNTGDFTTEQVLGKGGMLEAIQAAKQKGLVRFIGCSGHLRPERFVPILETGQIDLLMVAMNFVDRFIYNFEEKVLPVARKHNTAIVGMKVLAGSQGGWGGYRLKKPGRLIGKHYRYAFRYTLSIPDLATAVVGIKSLEELRQAILAVREYQPLTPEEQEMLNREGRAMAAEWGEHFGPAV